MQASKGEKQRAVLGSSGRDSQALTLCFIAKSWVGIAGESGFQKRSTACVDDVGHPDLQASRTLKVRSTEGGAFAHPPVGFAVDWCVLLGLAGSLHDQPQESKTSGDVWVVRVVV